MYGKIIFLPVFLDVNEQLFHNWKNFTPSNRFECASHEFDDRTLTTRPSNRIKAGIKAFVDIVLFYVRKSISLLSLLLNNRYGYELNDSDLDKSPNDIVGMLSITSKARLLCCNSANKRIGCLTKSQYNRQKLESDLLFCWMAKWTVYWTRVHATRDRILVMDLSISNDEITLHLYMYLNDIVGMYI